MGRVRVCKTLEVINHHKYVPRVSALRLERKALNFGDICKWVKILALQLTRWMILTFPRLYFFMSAIERMGHVPELF